MGIPLYKPKQDIRYEENEMWTEFPYQPTNSIGYPLFYRNYHPTRIRYSSSIMDRRTSSRIHSLQPIRIELERQIQQCIAEKESLLEQLKVTIALLDQFILASSDTLPDFMNQEIPAVIELASSIASVNPNILTNYHETFIFHRMAERLPPYTARIYNIEHHIIQAHCRIREQVQFLQALH